MDVITNPAAMARAINSETSKDQEFLVFHLGSQQFGIDARKVQELRHYGTLTTVADGPSIVKGVVVWRGNIIPLIDLRVHFKGEVPLYDALTDVIILKLTHRFIGVVADGVSDVIKLAPEQCSPMQHTNSVKGGGGLIGSSIYNQRRLLLVDIDALVSGAGIAAAPKRKAA